MISLRSPLVLIGAATAAFVLSACNGDSNAATAPKQAPPKEVQVLTLHPMPVRDTSDYLGSLLSRQSVNVLPQVNGYVRKINVKPGEHVQAGDTLVEIDSREVAASLESAQANQNSSGARLDLARQTLERTEALYKEGLVSAQELERARADLRASEAASKVASAVVAQNQVQLQYRGVRAPVPGVVGDVLIRVGDYVTANTQLTSISQADVLEITVAVPAPRARTLTVQTPIELLDDAGNILVGSTLFFIAPQADPRTQLVEVKAVFPNTVGLRPSELVRARIVYSVRNALQVPALAVTRQSGQPFVFMVGDKDGQTVVTRKPVTLGALGDQNYVVEGGLKEGDKIVVEGLQMLRDGMAIKPKETQQTAPPPSPVPAPPAAGR